MEKAYPVQKNARFHKFEAEGLIQISPALMGGGPHQFTVLVQRIHHWNKSVFTFARFALYIVCPGLHASPALCRLLCKDYSDQRWVLGDRLMFSS